MAERAVEDIWREQSVLASINVAVTTASILASQQLGVQHPEIVAMTVAASGEIIRDLKAARSFSKESESKK